MKIFLAGVIQGDRADGSLHEQDYRTVLSDIVKATHPNAEFIDPHRENPDRLGWNRQRQADMFFEYAAKAAACDAMIAWLPTASMGTAVEMYTAHTARVPIVAVTPLIGTWAIFAMATCCLPDIAAFAEFVKAGRFAALLPGDPAALRGPMGAADA
jgi:hypothetical protein